MGSWLQAFGVLLLEVLLFGLGLLFALWANNLLPASWQEESWSLALVLAGTYLVLGAIPFPWRRRTALVAVAAFVVPLWIIGWFSWRIQYFLMFEHVGAWENLHRVILGPENLVIASLVCAAALLGQRLVFRRRTATTVSAV